MTTPTPDPDPQSDIPANFEICGHELAPGSTRDIAVPVTTMATGYNSTLAVRALHGSKPGPVMFVSAAIHGDEIIGTAIIQRIAAQLDPAALAGTVLLVPVANIFGFLNKTRYLPDRRDLNRSFPGNANGSLASQFAHAFFTEVVQRSTIGIDIHSAAVHRYNLPQIRIAAGDPHLIELATAFGPPIIIEAPLREGSMRALAKLAGVDMLLMETGEALRFDRLSIETGVAGIFSVMARLGMIDPHDALAEALANGGEPAKATSSVWVRAPRGGVTHRVRKSGDPVRIGDVLATVGGLFGEDEVAIVSPTDGIIIGHATLPVVYQGDALFHIARLARPEAASEEIEAIADAILAADGFVLDPEEELDPEPDDEEGAGEVRPAPGAGPKPIDEEGGPLLDEDEII
ncbi:MAG: succinylglutamate desuccinylase/aspartoacylase family protein [Parerythrobacter sp.]